MGGSNPMLLSPVNTPLVRTALNKRMNSGITQDNSSEFPIDFLTRKSNLSLKRENAPNRRLTLFGAKTRDGGGGDIRTW